MSTIEVFGPALCCNTGVCGEDVDQALVTFSADMDWVGSMGGHIVRYNLASEPMSFAENESVKQFLHLAGSQGLPLTLVDGITVLTGRYPDRTQLSNWAGLDPQASPDTVTAPAGAQLLELADSGGCCGGGAGGAASTSSCC